MKYPKFLNKNSNIYLISPSFGCSTEPYKSRLIQAISNLKKDKFNVIEGKYIFNNKNLLSDTKENIAKEFINAYENNDLLLSVGGGEMMISILDDIDFNLISSLKPTWFMGYSDNTNLTFLLTTLCDVATIYGANAPEFGVFKYIDYQENMIKLLKGKQLKFEGYDKYEILPLKDELNPLLNLNLTEDSNIILYPNKKIEFEGRIIGGCIDVISTLIGTKFDNIKSFNEKYKNIVWFFEACDMNVVEVSRRLIQMKYAGWFKNAKGFIFGRPLNNTPMFSNTMQDLIIDSLKDLNVPILMNADIGHVKPQIPIICGSIAKIKANNNKYSIEFLLK